jgi:hypothetical protein
MAPKKQLIEFLIDLASNPAMQRKYKDKGEQWEQLVKRELSEDDATLVLTENREGIEEKVNAQKTPAHTVWTSATVWL